MELHQIISQAVSEALNKLENNSSQKKDFDVIGLEEVCALTGYSKHTIYRMTSRHEMPFFKRAGGRKIFFSKKALEEWLLTGRI